MSLPDLPDCFRERLCQFTFLAAVPFLSTLGSQHLESDMFKILANLLVSLILI